MATGSTLDLHALPEFSKDQMSDFDDTNKVPGSDCPLKKLCVDCGTSKTPLWRGGPAGPKSLCNACGIRNRKRKWALLQMNKVATKKDNSEKKLKEVDDISINTSEIFSNYKINHSNSSSSSNGHSDSSSAKDRLMAMWEVLKPRNVRIEELSEEQQAAVLLMAMSH